MAQTPEKFPKSVESEGVKSEKENREGKQQESEEAENGLMTAEQELQTLQQELSETEQALLQIDTEAGQASLRQSITEIKTEMTALQTKVAELREQKDALPTDTETKESQLTPEEQALKEQAESIVTDIKSSIGEIKNEKLKQELEEVVEKMSAGEYYSFALNRLLKSDALDVGFYLEPPSDFPAGVESVRSAVGAGSNEYDSDRFGEIFKDQIDAKLQRRMTVLDEDGELPKYPDSPSSFADKAAEDLYQQKHEAVRKEILAIRAKEEAAMGEKLSLPIRNTLRAYDVKAQEMRKDPEYQHDNEIVSQMKEKIGDRVDDLLSAEKALRVEKRRKAA